LLSGLDASARRALVQYRLSGDKSSRLEDFAIQGLDSPETPLVLRVRYQVERALQSFDKQLVGPAPLSWERDALTASFVDNRRSPFELLPLAITAQVTVAAPAGFALPTAADLAQEHQDEFVRYTISPVTMENRLAWRLELARLPGRHAPARYDAYVDALTRLRRASQPQLILRPQ
jgi:hypothetical protein